MNIAVLRVCEDFRRKLNDYLGTWLAKFPETDEWNCFDIVHHERGMRIRLTIRSRPVLQFPGYIYNFLNSKILTIECPELGDFSCSFNIGRWPSRTNLSWLICFLLDPEWTQMEFRMIQDPLYPDLVMVERIESMDSFADWMKEVSYHYSTFVSMLDKGCSSMDSDQLSRYYVPYIKFFLYLEKIDIVYQHTAYLLSHSDDKRLSLLIPLLDPDQTLRWFSENDMESVPKLIEQLNQHASYEDLEL